MVNCLNLCVCTDLANEPINQEQQERIEQINQLAGQILADNEEYSVRIVDTERVLSEVRSELSDLQTAHADLTRTSSREIEKTVGAMSTAQEEVVSLRRQINALSVDSGRLVATLELEEQLKRQLTERLFESGKALTETCNLLQGKEVNEARLSAELRSVSENLTQTKVKLTETENKFDDMRLQLLESERRTAGLEALMAERSTTRQKGVQKRPISKPIAD